MYACIYTCPNRKPSGRIEIKMAKSKRYLKMLCCYLYFLLYHFFTFLFFYNSHVLYNQ